MLKMITGHALVHAAAVLAAYLGLISTLIPCHSCKEESDASAHSTPLDSGVTSSNLHLSGLEHRKSGEGTEAVETPSFKELQLALTKVCVSESGFQVRTNDCSLIYHVLRGRSVTGQVTMGIMRAYARKTFDEKREDSRRWILNLNHRFEEPEGWSENVTIPWSVRRAGFIEVYNHAGQLLRTRPKNTPCDVKVSHWGARGFRRELHLIRGWKLVECGRTNNDFWLVPGRQPPEEELEDEVALDSSQDQDFEYMIDDPETMGDLEPPPEDDHVEDLP